MRLLFLLLITGLITYIYIFILHKLIVSNRVRLKGSKKRRRRYLPFFYKKKKKSKNIRLHDKDEDNFID